MKKENLEFESELSSYFGKEDVKQTVLNHKKVRRFQRIKVEIPTIGGYPLTILGYSTTEPIQNPEASRFTYDCRVCDQKFSEKKKLTTHMRYHKQKPEQENYEGLETETENE